MASRKTSSWRQVAWVLLAMLVVLAIVARRAGVSRLVHDMRQPHAAAMQTHGPAPGEEGARLAGFSFRDIAGREIRYEELRGKVLLIDFWATWCEPCKVEMPGYQDLQDRYGERGLVVVGFAMDTDAAAVRQYAREMGIRYTLALSAPELQDKFGGILGLPTTIVVDRNSVIRRKVIGFEYKQSFETTLKEIL